MRSSNFEEIRARFLPQIESHLATFLNASKTEGQRLSAEMASYHLETGGKRLRALIPLYVYEVMGRNPVEAIPLGAAVEMVHNATLVHDDLQDGDEMRRNRATVWKKYSSAQAINCGDAMFYYAIRLVGALNTEPQCFVRLIDRLTFSTLNVIEGQAQEFAMKDEASPDVERYLGVIRGKTSGLFALPIVGAMEALGIDRDLCRAVERAAMDLGMLFQIQDDVLDVYGAKGRDRVATDVAEGKISIFAAHVYEVGSAIEKAELSQILRKPREQTSDADIQRAIAIFERNDAKGMAVGRIRAIQRQIEEDASLKACPEIRQVLIDLGKVFLEPLNGVL